MKSLRKHIVVGTPPEQEVTGFGVPTVINSDFAFRNGMTDCPEM